MTFAGIRDLKNNLSRYLRRLKPGQIIAVTDRGRVVPELRPPSRSLPATPLIGGYARLVAEGVIRPARERGDPLVGLSRVRAAHRGPVAALIREDRGD